MRLLMKPRFALFTLAVLATRGVAQENSDFIAYPKDYTSMTQYAKMDRQLAFNRLPGLSADYRIGPGDVLRIEVIGEIQEGVKVTGEGDITLPLIGPIPVAELTASEIEERIAKAFAQKQLLRDPDVLVYITQYHSKRIYILGEVDRPGEYAMSQPLTLMDAIILAGGLDLPAARYGYLHRPLKTGNVGPPMPNTLREPEVARPGTEVFRVDLQPLKEGGVLAQNIALKAGDVFVVPKRKMEVFYVIGEVKGPGSYEIPIGARLLVSQAISASGGPMATAKVSKGLLVRTDADGNRTEIKIDYLAILHGQQADVELRGNDIVFIPGSQVKTIAFGLLGTIPAMARRGVVGNGQ